MEQIPAPLFVPVKRGRIWRILACHNLFRNAWLSNVRDDIFSSWP